MRDRLALLTPVFLATCVFALGACATPTGTTTADRGTTTSVSAASSESPTATTASPTSEQPPVTTPTTSAAVAKPAPKPTPKPSPTTTRRATPRPAPTSAAPARPTATSAPRPAATYTYYLQRELVVELNKRRVALGLNPVEFSPELATAANKCVAFNLARSGLEHCGHEVLWASSASKLPDPKNLLDAWMSSPGHRTALTYTSSTKAGGSVAWNSDKTVAAININY